jgi:hypothetical protein
MPTLRDERLKWQPVRASDRRFITAISSARAGGVLPGGSGPAGEGVCSAAWTKRAGADVG